MAALIFSLVAANRRLLFGVASTAFWLKTTIVVAFSVGLMMSSRLWIGPRSYPTAPVSDLLQFSIAPADLLLFAALFALAAAILVAAKPQKFILAYLAVVAAFCLLDQTRWQPWVYQYGFLLATLALFSWDGEDVVGRTRAVNIARLIVATTYVFSGLQKVNANFVNSDFPWLVEPITNIMPAAKLPMHLLGMAAPLIQIGFGFGLLTTRYRRISLILAVAMHVFILAMFGPLGQNWNPIVWPWTAAMAVLDILLFSGRERLSLREMFLTDRRPYFVAVIAAFVILPCLSFFNLWDSFLSSAQYAGNLTEATLYVADAARDSLPPAIRSRLVHTSPDTNVLNIQRWAIEDVQVTSYPETRVFRRIAKAVCSQTPYPAQVVLLVREQRLFAGNPEIGYRCWDL